MSVSNAEIERIKKENKKLRSAITSMNSFFNSHVNYKSTKDTLNQREFQQFENGIKTAEILLEKRKTLLEKAIREKAKADRLAKKRGFWLRKEIGDIDIVKKLKIVLSYNYYDWFFINDKEDIERMYKATIEKLTVNFSTEDEAKVFSEKIEELVNDTNHKNYYEVQNRVKHICSELEL